MTNPIEFNNVSKKFRKGEKFNSIRDTVPKLFRKMISKPKEEDILEDQEFWALKDVNFTVKKGEFVGIIGPNGAGKSTILKLLSGIMIPNKGDLRVNGRLSALIEVTAGFHSELTGRENIYLNGTILGMKRKELDEKFEQIVEFSGIREFIDTPIKRYSSGMLSRLGFSVASHADPEVLLVDEVLAVGDISFQSKCAQKMRELLKGSVTIVLVSHNLALIQSLCKRVLLLDKGEILKEGTADEVIPYYENVVFRQTEVEFKKKLSAPGYKVKPSIQSSVKITGVQLLDEKGGNNENFNIGSNITIKIDYEAAEKIQKPVFRVDIMRVDGVLCCSSTTKDDDSLIAHIEGKGTIAVNFKEMNLAPGIYLTNISIWDKDLIHAYAIRKKDIFHIDVSGQNKHTNAVFLPKSKWT